MTFNLKNTKPVTGDVAGVYFVKNPDVPEDNGIYVININGQAPVRMSNPNSDLNGASYKFVYATGTPTENAIEFKNVYDATVSGDTLIYSPGTYEFPTTFIHNKDNVNIVSLTGNRDGIFTVTTGDTALKADANYSFVKGIITTKKIEIGTNLSELRIENCKGGDYSFNAIFTGQTDNLVCELMNCEGGSYSFGWNEFGISIIELQGILNSTIKNCIAGNNSFGYNNGIKNTKIYNCVGGNQCFGTNGGNGSAIVASDLYNCIAGNNSFGYDTLEHSANYYYCNGGSGSFIYDTQGIILFCGIDGSPVVV